MDDALSHIAAAVKCMKVTESVKALTLTRTITKLKQVCYVLCLKAKYFGFGLEA